MVEQAGELVRDVQALANDFVRPVRYQTGYVLPLVAAPIQFDHGVPVLSPAPELSGDSDAILAELGWDEERILQAKIRGAVS